MAQAVKTIIAEAETMATLAGARTSYATYAGDIAEAGRHLLEVIGDCSSARADQSPGCERFDLADLVDRACAMIALRAADKRIRIEPPIAIPISVMGDSRGVLQILINLLTNAVKFTPEGGCIALRLGTSGRAVMLDIADDGPGVPDNLRIRIFAEFERAPLSDGLGLGLPISRGLARKMGGDLELADSETGACFRLTLPSA